MPSPYDRGSRSQITPVAPPPVPTVKGYRRKQRTLIRNCQSARSRWYRERWRADYEAGRPNSHRRGYTRRWRKIREALLAEFPECRMCGRNAATEVDHIVPHRGDMIRFWDPDNLQGLCKTCHTAKTLSGD